MKYFFTILLLASAIITLAQPTFEKSYGAPGDGENQDDIKKLKQNRFLITGSTPNYGAGNFDAYCIMLNENGNLLWSKTYGTSYSNGFTKCWGTADGGFVICFTSYEGRYLYGDSISGIFVVKCDKDGLVQWSKCIKPAVPLTKAVSITPAYVYESKKGDIYVLCDWSGNLPDFTLTKLDAKGNLAWNTSVAQNTYSPYEYNSIQIAEAGSGDIVVAENAYGDNFYTFGNYIHLLLFSGSTGSIKKSKYIVANDNNRTALLSIDNFVIDKDKINITAGYTQGNTAGICWFSLTLNDNEVKAKYIPYTNQLSYQYLINQQLIQQPEEGFDSHTFYTKDGGYLFTYTGGSPDYNILLDRYDSLGRICPNFIKQQAIDTTKYETTITIAYQPYVIVHNTLVSLDTSVTVTDVTAQKTVCEGAAPALIFETNKTSNKFFNVLIKTGLQVYPNPTSDKITLAYETGRAATIGITVITREGRTVIAKTMFAGKGKQQTTLSVQNLPPGMYFIKLTGTEKTEISKFMKE